MVSSLAVIFLPRPSAAIERKALHDPMDQVVAKSFTDLVRTLPSGAYQVRPSTRQRFDGADGDIARLTMRAHLILR